MAPTSKKRRLLASNEILSKSPSVSKKRKKVKDEDCNEKSGSKTKIKSSSPTVSKESKCETLICDNNSVKSKPDLLRTVSKKTERQKKSREDVSESCASVDEMDVQQLLALGERFPTETRSCDTDDNSTDSESDFEEVKNVELKEPAIPKEGVDITLEVPNICGKRKKKDFDLAVHLKRQMNRVRKDLQLLMHKVHVLCWIAHLRFVNNTLNNPAILETCMSLVKSKNLYPKKYADLTYLEGILKWYHKNIDLKKDFKDPLCTGGLFKEIKYQIEQKQAFTYKSFILIFIILLRVLGLKARIVMSFQVLPVKPCLLELYGDVIKARSEKLNKSKSKVEGKEENVNSEVEIKIEETKSLKKNTKRKPGDNSLDQETKKKGKKKKDQIEINSDNEFESEHFKSSLKLRNSKKKSNPKLKADNSQLTPKVKGRNSIVDNSGQANDIISSDENEDNDFTPKSLMKTKGKTKSNKKLSTANEENIKKKEDFDVWTEVYLEAEEKWLCVDVPRQKIHCIGEIYSRATHPVAYIIACNNDGTLKDVTKRYVPNWHSDTRKRRVDNDWWNETMAPLLPAKTAQDKEEDEDINRQLKDQPLPSSIAEFKDHPMYALRRHLLKFEAIYPPDAPTLGFVRGEPVYARECVFTLHSREMWYKQARLVRLKEEPYKIVKARPKYDKFTGEIKKDLPLELFGKWQTEDYIPPIAANGKVPRNEYGNVDLFKPCMLPIGTVHLQIPALNRIAKKLDIDCAPATVGFDFHSGGSHPVFDGFVVCEEFKDVLLDAWNKEIDESSKKEEEKKEKRVYGNWKRLIRGLLIREKLKIKYAFGENIIEEADSKPFAKASTSSSSE